MPRAPGEPAAAAMRTAKNGSEGTWWPRVSLNCFITLATLGRIYVWLIRLFISNYSSYYN